MQYQISSDNIEMSESIQILTKEKFERLETRVSHLDEDAVQVRVVINVAPEDKFEIKVVANINGKEYFTDETNASMEHGLIECVSELIRMIDKDQEKNWDQVREVRGKA